MSRVASINQEALKIKPISYHQELESIEVIQVRKQLNSKLFQDIIIGKGIIKMSVYQKNFPCAICDLSPSIINVPFALIHQNETGDADKLVPATQSE